MKKISYALFVLQSVFICGQTAPNPYYIPPYTLLTGQDTQGSSAIIAGSGGYNASGTGQAVVEGVDYAAAIPGYQAAGFNGVGYGCLRINPNKLHVASFHPLGWTGIPKYDRFEIGVKLPDNIQAQIDSYIQTGLNGTNRINPYDPDQIKVECIFTVLGSPSVPIKRHGFYEANSISASIIPGSQTTCQDLWVTTSRSEYPFRIRFAPPLAVAWQGIVNIYFGNTPNTPPNFTSYTFDFTVADNNNPGHLAISPNPKVQKFMYPAANNKIFYGVGRDAAYADYEPSHLTSYNPCGPNGGNQNEFQCNQPYYEWKSRPSSHSEHRHYIRDLADNGCNFLRVRLDRTSVPIEETPVCHFSSFPDTPPPYEVITPLYNAINDLTNFSRNEKYMWEMDNTVSTFEIKGIHMLLTILDHADFSTADPSVTQSNAIGWWGNPYRKLLQANNPAATRDDFFLDQTAIKIFEKRLYYIEARWGYSTSIGAWEMFNETENMYGSTIGSPWNVNSSQIVGGWLCDRRSFLHGNDIYPQHPVTNGTARNPPTVNSQLASIGDQVNWVQTGNHDNCLDLYTDHIYKDEVFPDGNVSGPRVYRSTTAGIQDISLLYSRYWELTQISTLFPFNGHFPTGPNKKPHLLGEYGLDKATPMESGGPLTFHNHNWGSLFCNSASIALIWADWFGAGGIINPYHTQYKPLRAFVDRIDFNTLLLPDRNVFNVTNNNPATFSVFWRQPIFIYGHEDLDDFPTQTYWMRTENADIVYGWTHNTNANFLRDYNNMSYCPNLANCPPSQAPQTCDKCSMTTLLTSWNCSAMANNLQIFQVLPNTNNTVVQGLAANSTYQIQLYDTWNASGSAVGNPIFATTTAQGRLDFDVPMDCVYPPTHYMGSPTPALYNPDYAFIATIFGQQPRPGNNTASDSTDANDIAMGINNLESSNVKTKIYPVPASDKVYLAFNRTEWAPFRVYVIDELGKVTEKTLNADNSIDTRELANGFYTLKMKDEKHEQLFKLVIQR